MERNTRSSSRATPATDKTAKKPKSTAGREVSPAASSNSSTLSDVASVSEITEHASPASPEKRARDGTPSESRDGDKKPKLSHDDVPSPSGMALLPAIQTVIENPVSNHVEHPNFTIGVMQSTPKKEDAHESGPSTQDASDGTGSVDISTLSNNEFTTPRASDTGTAQSTLLDRTLNAQASSPAKTGGTVLTSGDARDVLKSLPLLPGVLPQSRWADADHPIMTGSFRATFSDAVAKRLENISVHAGTNRIVNPAIGDPTQFMPDGQTYLCRKGPKKSAVHFMTLGIVQTANIGCNGAGVAQQVNVLPVDIAWYRTTAFFAAAFRNTNLYYPTFSDALRFSTKGKFQSSNSFIETSPSRGATTSKSHGDRNSPPVKASMDYVPIYDGSRPFAMPSRESLDKLSEVPIGAAVLLTFTVGTWDKGKNNIVLSLNIQDVTVLAFPVQETGSDPREEEAWLGVTEPAGYDDDYAGPDGGSDVLV